MRYVVYVCSPDQNLRSVLKIHSHCKFIHTKRKKQVTTKMVTVFNVMFIIYFITDKTECGNKTLEGTQWKSFPFIKSINTEFWRLIAIGHSDPVAQIIFHNVLNRKTVLGSTYFVELLKGCYDVLSVRTMKCSVLVMRTWKKTTSKVKSPSQCNTNEGNNPVLCRSLLPLW